MVESNITIGPLQARVRWFARLLTAVVRYPAWTPPLEHRLDRIEQHLETLTEVVLIMLGNLSGQWDDAQRERAFRQVANFTRVSRGVAQQRNPISATERARLQGYLGQLETGGQLSPSEAEDFRRLAEEEARAHPREDWAKDLLKLGLVAFALYTLSEIFKPNENP
jgi:hypothetical protein